MDDFSVTRNIFEEVEDVLLDAQDLIGNGSLSLLEPLPIDSTRMNVVPQVSCQEFWQQHNPSASMSLLDILQPLVVVENNNKNKRSTTTTTEAFDDFIQEVTTSKRPRLSAPASAAAVVVPLVAPSSSSTTTTRPQENCIRDYQEEQWDKMYQRLVHYFQVKGHSNCPLHYQADPALGNWCKRQRYQYRKKMEGQHSTLTQERQDRLTVLNFTWDSHQAAWNERYQELVDYQRQFGHLKVRVAQNAQLAVWIKCQRRQHRLYLEGKKGSLSPDRKALLDQIGFEWNPRGF